MPPKSYVRPNQLLHTLGLTFLYGVVFERLPTRF